MKSREQELEMLRNQLGHEHGLDARLEDFASKSASTTTPAVALPDPRDRNTGGPFKPDPLGDITISDHAVIQFQHVPAYLSADKEQQHGEQLIILTNRGELHIYDADTSKWTELQLPEFIR